MISQNELARRAQAGDQSAFAELYRKSWPRVLGVCQRFDYENGEDLAQEAMLQMYRKLGSFRGDAQFSTWMYRLAVNTCLMSKRKGKIEKRVVEFVDTIDENGKSWLENIQDERSLESFLVAKLTLVAALGELPDGYKSMVVAHELFGMEHQEIANKYGCSVGNSKSQVHKAKERIRELVNGTCRRKHKMESERCGLCKDAGKPDIMAHHKSYLDGQGKRVPAMCFYHRLGQTPPWLKSVARPVSQPVDVKVEVPSGPVNVGTVVDVPEALRKHDIGTVECQLKISEMCEKRVPAAKPRKICKPCWSERIRGHWEARKTKSTVPSNGHGVLVPYPVEVEADNGHVQVGDEFVNGVWVMLNSTVQNQALEAVWDKIPLALRMKIVEAGLQIAKGGKKIYGAFESVGTGQVTV